MKPPCTVRRVGLRGPGIAASTALDGTQIVCSYGGANDQQEVHVHYPLIDESMRSQLEAGNYAPSGCILAEKSEQRFEPLFGDYPDNAPAHLRLWRAWMKYYTVS